MDRAKIASPGSLRDLQLGTMVMSLCKPSPCHCRNFANSRKCLLNERRRERVRDHEKGETGPGGQREMESR